jgi:3-phenylpropionate/trans-cinnamate dioxygenase ferredoxin reductase subunit
MPDYKYLIVGGGMAADAAVAGIRELDPDGSIGVIGAEADRPYTRPLLSKGLWKDTPLEKVWRGTEQKGATLHLGRSVRAIDRDARQAIDDAGERYGYERLLLATGGTPRRLPFGGDQVIYYRTLADYHRLHDGGGPRVAVIGGGFIGWEIAAALAMNGRQVTMVFPGDAIGARLYPPGLAAFLNDYYREKGVTVMTNDEATGLEERGDALELSTKGGATIAADQVVAGIGIEPNVKLAEAAGLPVENGVLVDEQLRTADEAIFAAGDVAAFPSAALGRRVRVEHEDNALTMGKHAGRNLAHAAAGEPLEPYKHLPFFYSDLFDLGYEAVGDTDAKLELVEDWKEPNKQGVVYYLRDGRVRGVLLWNVWDKVEAARALIDEPGPFDEAGLKGRIAFD